MIKIASLSEIPLGGSKLIFFDETPIASLISMAKFMLGTIDVLIEVHRYRMDIFPMRLFNVSITCGNLALRNNAQLKMIKLKYAHSRLI